MAKTSQDVQQSRLSQEERDLIKNSFKNKPDILLALRNLYLGLGVDKGILEPLFISKSLKELLRKIFLPELDPKIPIGQSLDLWMTIKVDEFYDLNIRAREIMIEWMKQALDLMDNLNGKLVDLTVADKPMAEIEPFLLARNTFVSHIELQLTVIRTLAEQEPETEAEEIKRKFKNSNK